MQTTRFQAIEQLRAAKTGTIQDALDELGFFHQSLSPEYRMVSPPRNAQSFAGPANTVLLHALDHCAQPPFENSVRAWQNLEKQYAPGDVVVWGFEGRIAACELTGGMLATVFQRQGAVGWLGTYVRDLGELDAMDMGFVAMGTHPAIARGRIAGRGVGVPVTLGGVLIRPGDLVVADGDGTVVVPKEDETVSAVVAWVSDYAAKERAAHADMERGELAMSDIIAKYRII